jgi:dienelactone hydrolase
MPGKSNLKSITGIKYYIIFYYVIVKFFIILKLSVINYQQEEKINRGCKMRALFVLLLMVYMSDLGWGQIKTDSIEYKHGDVLLQGFLAYDGLLKSKRPGVLIIHEWWGHNQYVRQRARQLAELGYVAFALDMYGKGVLAKTMAEAKALAGKFYEDRQLMRDRAAAGLEILKQQKNVDATRLAAVGYCFGGSVALELARSGADLRCVVCFHGGLKTNNPEDARNIKGTVLVMLGADDPNIPADEIAAFQNEMRQANVDWYLVSFGNAVHSFTNPDAGTDNSKGAAYNYNADQRSWTIMRELFLEKLR